MISIAQVAKVLLAVDMLEQYAKIGYWVVGIVGWYYIIQVCRKMLTQGGS